MNNRNEIAKAYVKRNTKSAKAKIKAAQKRVELLPSPLKVRGKSIWFVNRETANKLLDYQESPFLLHNYEMEEYLKDRFHCAPWVVTDWCPRDGRFCTLAKFVKHPHPPLSGMPPKPPHTAVPWNEFDPNDIPTLEDLEKMKQEEKESVEAFKKVL